MQIDPDSATGTVQDSAEMSDRPEQRWASRTILVGVALVGLMLAWMPASYSMVRRWMGAQGYYSHGLLVPLISIYLSVIKKPLYNMLLRP